MELKTTAGEFEIFKKTFLKYVDLFGLKNYRITFQHIKLDENYAEIQRDCDSFSAIVRFTNYLEDCNKLEYGSPEIHAKHEAIHLLLTFLVWKAQSKYITPTEIDQAEESLVRVLEKVIP
jgi:hypothetical protein